MKKYELRVHPHRGSTLDQHTGPTQSAIKSYHVRSKPCHYPLHAGHVYSASGVQTRFARASILWIGRPDRKWRCVRHVEDPLSWQLDRGGAVPDMDKQRSLHLNYSNCFHDLTRLYGSQSCSTFCMTCAVWLNTYDSALRSDPAAITIHSSCSTFLPVLFLQ